MKQDPASPLPPRQPAGTVAPNPATILVVDDDDHVRDALVDELGTAYSVETASCGAEAFDALATRRYDVVISDLRMPDHDGIEVLEFARRHQHDAVRILLTGYLDDRAHRALLADDAPFKVGKPWHDEIEVVVRRGLEFRETARRLSASVSDALGLARFDDELATATAPDQVAEVFVRRALAIEGVTACCAVMCRPSGEVLVAGIPGGPAGSGSGWNLDLPLDADGVVRVRARGLGGGARELVTYLAHRAQRRAGVVEARLGAVRDQISPTRPRVNQLMSQATLGAMTASLLHDLASVMQAMTNALDEVVVLAEEAGVPALASAAADATDAGQEAVSLFIAMRRFLRGGDVMPRPIRVDELVQRALKLAGGYVRERAKLVIGALPDLEVNVAEPLFLQVLVNVLRNAANASPTGGTVHIDVDATASEIVFTVTDDGPGVAPELHDSMFEPFASRSRDGTGLGLAISAYVMQLHGGTIRYRRATGRGARFSASLPRLAPGT